MCSPIRLTRPGARVARVRCRGAVGAGCDTRRGGQHGGRSRRRRWAAPSGAGRRSGARAAALTRRAHVQVRRRAELRHERVAQRREPRLRARRGCAEEGGRQFRRRRGRRARRAPPSYTGSSESKVGTGSAMLFKDVACAGTGRGAADGFAAPGPVGGRPGAWGKPFRGWGSMGLRLYVLPRRISSTTVLEQDQFYSSYSNLYLSKETSLPTMWTRSIYGL